MTNATLTMPAIADDTHPLALTPAQEGRIAFAVGDDLEDNPFDRTHNPEGWSEWHDAWMASQRYQNEWQEECDREMEELLAEAERWD